MNVAASSAEGPPPTAWEWLQAALLAANLIWTTVCLGGFRPETKVVTFALTGALLVVHLVACAIERRRLRATTWAGWTAVPFLVYAAINVLTVTPVRWLGWLDWFGWANFVAVFWVAVNALRSSRAKRAVFFVLIALGISAVLLACHQRFVEPGWLMLGRTQAEQFLGRASGPFGIPNSLAGFLILILPATGALAVRRAAVAMERIWWSWVTAVLAFGLVLTVSRGGWIALCVALISWPLAARGWPWKHRALAGLVAFAASVAVGALLLHYAPGVRERFERLLHDSGELSRPILWRAAGEIFRAHPLVGSGAGSFNTRFEQHRPVGFVDDPQWVHNEYLNTASDYGALGLLLLLGGAIATAVRGGRTDHSLDAPSKDGTGASVRTGARIGVLAFALQLVVDFHLKIPALAMAFAIVAALAIDPPTCDGPIPSRRGSNRIRVSWLCAAAVVTLLMVPVLRLAQAEAIRYRARESINRNVAGRTNELAAAARVAESALRRATTLAPGHAQAWSDVAFALELQAYADPSKTGAVAEPAVQAAQRALALSRAVPEFWIRLGVALDLRGSRGAGEEALAHATRVAPASSHAWYYYAHHLSFDTNRREEALRAIATCLSLDPGNGAAEALRAKLNARW